MPLKLEDLPNEILIQIIDKLPIGDIHFRLVLVNRRFRELVQSQQYEIVQHLSLDLTDGNHGRYPLGKLRTYCQKEKPKLKALTIRFPPKTKGADNSIYQKDFSEATPYLATLQGLQVYNPLAFKGINQLQHLEHVFLDTIPYQVWQSLTCLTKLRTLRVQYLGNVHDYEDGFFGDNCPENFWMETRQFAVTTLHVNQLFLYNHNKEIRVDFGWLWKHFPNLKVLTIDSVHIYCTDYLMDLVSQLAGKCLKLESLRLGVFYYPGNQKLWAANRTCFRNLKSFYIKVSSHCPEATELCQRELLKCPTFSKSTVKLAYCIINNIYRIVLASKSPTVQPLRPSIFKHEPDQKLLDKIMGAQ